MTRKRKRNSSGARWKRRQAAKVRAQTLGSFGSIRERIELGSLEFASIFVVTGGRERIGSEITIRTVVDRFGRNPGKAVAPHILDMDRGKVAAMAARTNDAAAIARAKERLQVERKAAQVDRLERAHERRLLKWCRQEVPDQRLRSVLVCSGENGESPGDKSDSLVVCYRGNDGRYHVAEEKWLGYWSESDMDGFRERIEVELDEAPVTFADEKEAHRVVLSLVHGGELERLAHRKDARHFQRLAKGLIAWKRKGSDMKKVYETAKKEGAAKRQPGSRWVVQQ
jgi:hypothetical protein